MELEALLGGFGAGTEYRTFLETTSKNAKSVIGLVAYWTISEVHCPNLIDLVAKENSFICVDPSHPTDLHLLLKYNRDGNNFYAYKYELNFEGNEGLLHSKMLLFDMDGDDAILVIGSHNMTVRAITGINIEHSIVYKISKQSELYKNVRNQIFFIKETLCTKILFVKNDDEDTIPIFTIVGDNMYNLKNDEIFTVFFKENKEAFKTNEQKILVLAIEAETDEKFLYLARILQTGSFNKNQDKSTGIEFSERRYAEKDHLVIPFLFKEKMVERQINKEHSYFNTIEILSLLKDHEIYYYSNKLETKSMSETFVKSGLSKDIVKKIKLNKNIIDQGSKISFQTDFNKSKIKEYYSFQEYDNFLEKEKMRNEVKYNKNSIVKRVMISPSLKK